ncbi:hypothetical protein MAM1_0096c05070 [Mucor ambiguus]|uniref:Uncharacterized protein n=1 Tax=Mucor ambiguus TaxID=91626 RepID=A0A0C9ME19_9FUNG|nr:hypothetical protein MAM1_0096c05070 [Mucor ambiguus]
MSSGQEYNSSINDELFHLYTEYQLCKIKNKPSLWNAADTEKNALISILTQCKNINGNTLRLVMKDIFENSVAKYTDSSGSTAVHHTPHTNSSNGRIPQVIANITEDDNDDTDSTASEEAATSSTYIRTRLSERMATNLDNAAVSPRNILSSSTLKRGRSLEPQTEKKQKLKLKGKIDESGIISEMLVRSNIAEIRRLVSEVGQTKVMLRKRIYAINDSVLENHSSALSTTFSVLDYASCPHTTERTMYRCQENFIGYRFGKLVERLRQEYSEWEAYNKAKEHYDDLQRELKRQNKTYFGVRWSLFNYYSIKMVQYVNEFGIYCLFIPEVISPTKFKRTPFEDLSVALRHVDESCSVFRGIVQLDREGNIIVPHRETPSEGHHMNNADIGCSVSRY